MKCHYINYGTMAKTEEKLRIFELFRRGISVAELEKTSAIPRRTLYRWFNEFIANSSSQDKEEVSKVKEDISKVQVQTESKVKLELDEIDFRDDWVNVANKSSIKGCLINGRIAEKLSEIMLEQLNQDDLNFRAVGCLSSAINNHFRLQRDFGMFYLLDINKAIKMLENSGYEISNPSEPLPREEVDLSGMTAEELAREYKKLLEAA